MILIISSQADISTSEVIDWLLFYNIRFIRVSENDMWRYISISIENNFTPKITFSINKKEYSFADFSVIWYRRSFINLQNFVPRISIKDLSNSIKKHINNEQQEIHQFAINYVKSLFAINAIKDTQVNKLALLQSAADIGLLVPKTLITSNKSDLLKFIKTHKQVITKNISQGVFISSNKHIMNNYTEMVTMKEIKTIPDTFSLSLFQELVQKWIELRIFFIDKKFYTSAIFSQDDKKTRIDFRNYNHDKPNRTPPFVLPQSIKAKLFELMKINSLKSGSIDMILTPNDEYVFLEVNPIGLFTQVSVPCNYYLEKKIALFLKSYEIAVKQ